MGYDLSNTAGGYVRFTGSGWDLALAVARHHGWKPAGIPRPASWKDEDGPWEDEYWMNAGQQVTPEDASALAEALDRAVASPDFIDSVQRIKSQLNDSVAEQCPQWTDDLQWITPDQASQFRVRLIEFAAFAHQGPFVIE